MLDIWFEYVKKYPTHEYQLILNEYRCEIYILGTDFWKDSKVIKSWVRFKSKLKTEKARKNAYKKVMKEVEDWLKAQL